MMPLPAFIRNPLDKRIRSWLKKRSSIDNEITLTQKRIYIFLSREGLLYGMLLLVTFVAGINYANNLVLGLCFYLASVLVICIHYTYAQLSGLKVSLLDVSNAEMGNSVRVRVQLSATGSKPHKQIQLFYELPSNYATPSALASNNNKSQQTNAQIINHVILTEVLAPQIATFYLPTTSRGKFVLPRLKITSVYPLGILRTWTYLLFKPHAWVWPKPSVFANVGSNLTHSHDDAMATGQKKGQNEFEKLDNYIAGESLARVSWRHLASGRGMLTKHFSDPVGKDIILDYHDMPASTHEAKLSQLSYAVQQLSSKQIAFAIHLPEKSLALDSGDSHELQALLLLAKAPKRDDSIEHTEQESHSKLNTTAKDSSGVRT